MTSGLPLRTRLAQWAVRAPLHTPYRIARVLLPGAYASDGLISIHRHAFVDDPAFQRAYQRGVRALGGQDFYHWQWRVHIGLWAAANASRLDGDFVECGVSYGFMSSAVMEFLDWDRLGKTFYLLDTFAGLDPRLVTNSERCAGALNKSRRNLRYGFYPSSADSVRDNFAQWCNQRIIVGAIPETLDQVDAQAVAFLHIDMNCAAPEVDALHFFWPRLTPGAFVLLDDYAFIGFEEQRLAMNALASELGVAICALPTGQGLLLKPARAEPLD
ncbi:TylF/MycF/NovP-related O-methyltransferase [Mycolicibacterium sp. ND9-15]|uniref:TylF/MycF/NovP-related O-methyltransferase n=1 Tax=Mycolicibacterium sp. ND9-15 TaxID=3042320 RepID=UPI002DD9E7FD|nr:TylF/MycF/NovP-related O-methyltransferase [Mycolicibacterium sp. ND9-15]WSE54933.1 TylF/MycF/NovP-related O-methyltransferase [Mycolicibacterium sp. ND9-15]